MDFPDQPPRYTSYLLTKWEERGQDAVNPVVWRYALEDIRNGRKYVFVTFEQLIAHLRILINGEDSIAGT